MSYWDQSSSEPYGRVSGFLENSYNTVPTSSSNTNVGEFLPRQYDSQFYQSYVAEPASNSNKQNFGASNVQLGLGTESSLAFNSKLTPLAKEFTPRSNMEDRSTFYGDRNKSHGAIKKNMFWNKDNRYVKPKQKYNNYSAIESDKSKNEYLNNYKYGKANNKRSTNVDQNKSYEQNQVVEDTKFFVNHFKSTDSAVDCNEGFSRHMYRENIPDNVHLHENVFEAKKKNDLECNSSKNGFQAAYIKNNYHSRNKNYKSNYYKRDDYYQNDRYNGDTYNSNKFFQKRTNYQPVNDKGESDRKKTFDPYRNRKFDSDKLKKKMDAASQRERLQQQVISNTLECLVCCERIRSIDEIWACKQCYHILHLQCTKQWAQSSKLEAGWRCPACQNVYQDIPAKYLCYCTKQTNPMYDPNEMPHSCGQQCSRVGRSCLHTCTLICHPGPCPDCSVMTPRSCCCGATKPILKCSSSITITCEGICGKTLSCGFHKCDKNCHPGDCEECILKIQQECYCGKQGRKVKCSDESRNSQNYNCGDICDKLLECGNHKCENECHEGTCNPCSWSPNKISTCPCGQTKLLNERKSCLDDIPCCDKVCKKILLCGQPSSPHVCQSKCHAGLCPPCSLTTIVRCRCGHMDKEISCEKVTTKADDARCEKKCTKKRLCGKHKCNQLCCIEIDHICPLPCNRTLSCGQHRCEQTCHKGHCSQCWRTSFDELYCECGTSVLYPPIACGTRPPTCNQPCSRIRACNHDVLHNCHTGPCPPCTVLSKKWCYGKHQQRSTIQCHQESFSCGLPCGKDMPCGRHKCVQPCHTGACKVPCTQPCIESRTICGHSCNQPCHEIPCPETSCKKSVAVTCQCGLRKSNRICHDLMGEYQNIAMSQLVSTMEEMQLGRVVDLAEITNVSPKIDSLKLLDCNDECRLMERNRRLAIGLQIRNPDLSSKLSPRYSEFMRNWAKKDPKFCQHIHEKLTELVKLAKQSKQKSRSYSFETMNREKRQFVHECCEHFGCESVAYDPEPNRNVVATAFKEKSWLPSASLLEVIQRENGLRKVPGPQQLGKRSPTPRVETVSLKLSGRVSNSSTTNNDYIDYFDNPPK